MMRTWRGIGVVMLALLGAACGDEVHYSAAVATPEPEQAAADGEGAGGEPTEQATSCQQQQWTRRYATFETQRALTVRPWGDGFMIGGSADSQDQDFYDVWSLRINARGEVRGEYQQDGPNFESVLAVLPTSDGGSVAFGQANYNAYEEDLHLWRADADHKLVTDHHYEGPGSDSILHVGEHPDGGYLAVASSLLGERGMRQGALWFLRFGEDGALLQEHLTEPGPIATVSALQTGRGTLLMTQLTFPVGGGELVLREFSIDGVEERAWSHPTPGLRLLGSLALDDRVLMLTEAADGALRLSAVSHAPDRPIQLLSERDLPDLKGWSVRLEALPSGQGAALLADRSDEAGGGLHLETVNALGETLTLDTLYVDASATYYPQALRVTPDGTVWFAALSQDGGRLDLFARDPDTGMIQREALAEDSQHLEVAWRGGLMALDSDSVLVTFNHTATGLDSVVMVGRRNARCVGRP